VIQHVPTASYSPQSNGVVEHLHGTLNPMITKCIEKKGNWADKVPIFMFFIRMTPSSPLGSLHSC